MRDASYLLGLAGLIVLIGASILWWRIARTPDAVPPTKANDKRSNSAATVIGIALLLSAIAAVVAIIGFFQP